MNVWFFRSCFVRSFSKRLRRRSGAEPLGSTAETSGGTNGPIGGKRPVVVVIYLVWMTWMTKYVPMGKVMTLDVAILYSYDPKWHWNDMFVISEMVPMSNLKVTHFFAKLCFCVLIKLFCCGGMMRDSLAVMGLGWDPGLVMWAFRWNFIEQRWTMYVWEMRKMEGRRPFCGRERFPSEGFAGGHVWKTGSSCMVEVGTDCVASTVYTWSAQRCLYQAETCKSFEVHLEYMYLAHAPKWYT